jgi:hypothetical protein
MTDAEKLEFLDHWLIDASQAISELRAAIQVETQQLRHR